MAALKEMNQDRHGIAIDDCWNRIGVWGDEKPRCKELEKVVHCVNCKVYSGAGRLLLDRPADQDYIANWSEQLKREKNRKHENMVSVVVFRIADEWLALSARLFQEVGEMRVVHRVPHSKTKVLRCQDFAHLQIACLRSLGLATRYVSGYLLTHPPPGQPKLVGSDASHAWISVWAGELGWIISIPR